jgi:hypothetical protein
MRPKPQAAALIHGKDARGRGAGDRGGSRFALPFATRSFAFAVIGNGFKFLYDYSHVAALLN